MHNTWVSCAWALQGILTLTTGFVAREKVMRVSGLALFATVTFRLFLSIWPVRRLFIASLLLSSPVCVLLLAALRLQLVRPPF